MHEYMHILRYMYPSRVGYEGKARYSRTRQHIYRTLASPVQETNRRLVKVQIYSFITFYSNDWRHARTHTLDAAGETFTSHPSPHPSPPRGSNRFSAYVRGALLPAKLNSKVRAEMIIHDVQMSQQKMESLPTALAASSTLTSKRFPVRHRHRQFRMQLQCVHSDGRNAKKTKQNIAL